jgi:hypothetical protein
MHAKKTTRTADERRFTQIGEGPKIGILRRQALPQKRFGADVSTSFGFPSQSGLFCLSFAPLRLCVRFSWSSFFAFFALFCGYSGSHPIRVNLRSSAVRLLFA